MDTHFINSLNVCSIDLTNLQLCFSNISSQLNDSNIHLYQTIISNCINPYTFRKYVKSFKITIGDSEVRTAADDLVTQFSKFILMHPNMNYLSVYFGEVL